MRPTLAFSIIVLIGIVYAAVNEPERHGHPDFAVGVHLLYTGQTMAGFPQAPLGRGQHLRYARQMTGDGGWVLQLVTENDMRVEKWQDFLDACARLGLRPILRLASINADGEWAAPGDDIATAWGEFFSQLRLDHPLWVVVGNEPNNGAEWGGIPKPAEYAHFYVSVAQHLRPLGIQVAPAALDLYAPHTNGLPFPGGTTALMDAAAFFEAMFAAEPDLMAHVDFWNSHVYPLGAFHGAPWEQEYRIDRIQGAEGLPIENPPYGVYNRGVNSYVWEIWYLQNVIGVTVPDILITEFGYRHANPYNAQSWDSGGALNDVNRVAEYVEMAIFGDDDRDGWLPLSQDPRVMGVVYFALAGTPDAWSHTNMLRVDGNGRIWGTYPHYDALVKRRGE